MEGTTVAELQIALEGGLVDLRISCLPDGDEREKSKVSKVHKASIGFSTPLLYKLSSSN